MAADDLRGRRTSATRAWTSWVDRREPTDDDEPTADVRPEIMASWERSADAIGPDVTEAPLADPDEITQTWDESPLHAAVFRLESELRRAAEDGDLVVAVTDPQTRILWTYGGRVMRRKAENINFVPGGRWDEASVGTNALDLALRADRTSTVFSAEHFAPIVHNWVCWAAPVHDPQTGEQLGVLDLSTTWDRAHPIGAATAGALARLLEREVLPSSPGTEAGGMAGGRLARLDEPGLSLTLLGAAEARLGGVRLLLTRRQTEILAILALHPQGLQFEQLHALLYGDERVSPSTLKAEVSHLRSAIGGQLASRPYRLTLLVTSDIETVLTAIRQGDVRAAVDAYGGDFMPGTNSPYLGETADYLAVAVREAVLSDPTPEAAMRYSDIAPYDTEIPERALHALGGRPHALGPLLKARVAAARP